MNSMEKLSRQIAKATRGSKTKPYDTKGVVKSVKDGVAMVHFYGGVDETPVEMSINATVGDEVYVRSSGGRAFIVGNNSKPPTDDSTAILARLKAIVAERAALLAHQVADDALALAEGIHEHFWHNNTGAHITQVTQEEYEDDPANAGGNLLMTSQGMAIRDGTTELATFTGTGAQMGKNNQWHVNVLSNALEFNPPTGSNAETIKILTGGNDYGQLLFSYTDSGYLYETYLCNGELYILRYNQSSQVDEYISLTADGLLLNDGGTNSTYITPTSASIGGHPSGLYTEDVLIVDGLTVGHGANGYATTNKSVAKTGYTPIGIVGMHLTNASTGGVYNTFVFPHSWYLSNNTAYFILRNTHASSDAVIKITATILYAKV